MKIVIDLQACQAPGSANRGIGRYSFSLAEAMLKSGGEHEFVLVGNEAFPDALLEIRKRFKDAVAPDAIKSFRALSPVTASSPSNHFRRYASELLREKFLSDLKPDFVHVSSFFEGAHDDAVTSIGSLPTDGFSAITLYDLIPLLKQNIYLSDAQIKRWYLNKVGMLRRAELLLAISDATRSEALTALNLDPQKVVNISSAADDVFRQREYSPLDINGVLRRHNLTRDFIMYTGGIDGRKNIESLIRSYSKIPIHLRNKYQLAIVCSVSAQDRARLSEIARVNGIKDSNFVLTGYVSEADLVALYNLCSLFVFPSLHEGFGLPVLEAMACGAPAIGSNNSSIPEVIGREDALFNPQNEKSITAKITEVLNNSDFARNLREHSLQRSKAFSWDSSAKRTIEAMEEVKEQKADGKRFFSSSVARPTLALISPLPPAKSGIADYSAKLLPYLAVYYNIEVVTDRPIVEDWIWSNCNIISPEEFEARDDQNIYDRILYHFGNSDFHEYMFDLLARRPGTVVLHDYFLSGIESWREHHSGTPNHFADQLVRAHGYKALVEHTQQSENYALWNYPVNAHVVENAYGLIVHSANSLAKLKSQYGLDDATSAQMIPIAQAIASSERGAARARLGLREDDFVICCFGFLGETKLNHIAIEGFLDSALSQTDESKLIFVGEGSGAYYTKLLDMIDKGNARERIYITGFTSAEDYQAYLAAGDVALQFRARSRGETSAAILDCAAHGLAIITNAHGTFAELDQASVMMLPDRVSSRDVSSALELMYTDRNKITEFTRNFTEILQRNHAPSLVAKRYVDAIEAFWSENYLFRERAIPTALRRSQFYSQIAGDDVISVVETAVSNRVRSVKKSLFLDLSELVRKDWGSGIQAVVKSVLRSLVMNYSDHYNIVPVYFKEVREKGAYYAARTFSNKFFGDLEFETVDETIDPSNGDIFLGVDFDYFGPVYNRNHQVYKKWRARGVSIYFVVYDILPVLEPKYFQGDSYPAFYRWLVSVAESADGLICISKSVEMEISEWLAGMPLNRATPLQIGHFHLGTDLRAGVENGGSKVLVEGLGALNRTVPTLLMVGTIEPRKGYDDILTAAELLWEQGESFNLIIVGKRGWLCDDIASTIRKMDEKKRPIYWLERVGAEISEIYSISDGVIAASLAEGFGLPLIEAAAYGRPLLARDIPVFREVARDSATFFSGSGADIGRQLKLWIEGLRNKSVVSSSGVKPQTWDSSARELMDVIEHNRWSSNWVPPTTFWKVRATDERLQTQVGVQKQGRIHSTQKAGVLMYGPYLALEAGDYKVQILGSVSEKINSEVTVQIAGHSGNEIFAESSLYGIHQDAEILCTFPRISITKDIKDLEVRIDTDGLQEITIFEIQLTRLE